MQQGTDPVPASGKLTEEQEAETPDDSYKFLPLGCIRTEDAAPCAYRLARKRSGELVLQGAFHWYEGVAEGVEWRDIPTVDLP